MRKQTAESKYKRSRNRENSSSRALKAEGWLQWVKAHELNKMPMGHVVPAIVQFTYTQTVASRQAPFSRQALMLVKARGTKCQAWWEKIEIKFNIAAGAALSFFPEKSLDHLAAFY